MPTNWQEPFVKLMKLPSESLVLGIIAFVAVALICVSGLALEYGWMNGEVEEAEAIVSHGFSSPSESFVPTLLNINTATVEQLQVLPGMNETLAKRVIWYRHQQGRFTEISQLLAVEGVDEETVFLLVPFITFE